MEIDKIESVHRGVQVTAHKKGINVKVVTVEEINAGACDPSNITLDISTINIHAAPGETVIDIAEKTAMQLQTLADDIRNFGQRSYELTDSFLKCNKLEV